MIGCKFLGEFKFGIGIKEVGNGCCFCVKDNFVWFRILIGVILLVVEGVLGLEKVLNLYGYCFLFLEELL